MKQFLALILLAVFVGEISCDCTLVCTDVNTVLDPIYCKCVPKIDCSIQPEDAYNCTYALCDVNPSACPKTCYCQTPSYINDFCVCYNQGVRNKTDSKCKCVCQPGFYGERCQMAADPCSVADSYLCSNVNCQNTNDVRLFNCQRKCFCCAGKACYNAGLLVTSGTDKCSCQCYNSTVFSSSDNCLTPDPAICASTVDPRKCSMIYQINDANYQVKCEANVIFKPTCLKACKIC